MPSLAALPLLAAPAWIWATSLMAAFVALTVLTMVLARIAVKERSESGSTRDAPTDPSGSPPPASPPRPSG